jgi:hypothetical protein
MLQEIPISKPLGLGDLLDRAFRLYRKRLGTLLLIAAILLVPWGIISGLATGRFMTSYMDALSSMIASPETPPTRFLPEIGSSLVSIMLISLASVVVTGITQLALVSQVVASLHGQTLSVQESLSRGWRRIWAFLGMIIARYFVIAVATMVTVIPVFIILFVVFAGSTMLGVSDNSVGSVLAGIGFAILLLLMYLALIVLFLAPAIYLSARWLVDVPSFIAESLGPIEALRRSWNLTRGHVWRVIGYSILLALISLLVIGLPIGVIQQIMIFVLPPSMLGFTTTIATALSSVVNVLWLPFNVAAVVLLYYDLRIRREGYDLSLRVAQLEQDLQSPDSEIL